MDTQQFEELIKKANENLATIPVKGKEYVEIKERVKAFRKWFPMWTLSDEIIYVDKEQVVVKSSVLDENGRLVSTGIAEERKSDNARDVNFKSYVENCETSAVGRALGLLGIGIETSIASADEVRNATSTKSITEEQKIFITELAKARGQKYNGDLNALSYEDAELIISKLKKAKEPQVEMITKEQQDIIDTLVTTRGLSPEDVVRDLNTLGNKCQFKELTKHEAEQYIQILTGRASKAKK